MSNFLWHSRGEKCIHWVWWDSVCRPIEEGGLGIRRLSHIQRCLQRNLMWLALKGDTLWGRFARAKYLKGNRFMVRSSSSPLWESIVSQEPCLRSIGLWIIGRGQVSFWGDSWLGSVLDGLSPCDLNLTVQQALPVINKFRELIPPDLEKNAQEIVLNMQLLDQLTKFT